MKMACQYMDNHGNQLTTIIITMLTIYGLLLIIINYNQQ